jgi:predicted lactoylglutathione lyase
MQAGFSKHDSQSRRMAMAKMIFVNLPVADLDRSMAFYTALGFTNEPKFTDETAACMVISDTIFVMLLTHAKWRTFTTRPIPDSGSSEVSLALTCDNRKAVNAMVEAGSRHGGTADVNPSEDHGFMYQRTIADPDGHVWEPMWMDPAVAESGVHEVSPG